MADPIQPDDLDLDEDLFAFDAPDELMSVDSEEEDLEAIFADFQEQKADHTFDPRPEERPEDRAVPTSAPEPAAPLPRGRDESTPVFALDDPEDPDDEDVFADLPGSSSFQEEWDRGSVASRAVAPALPVAEQPTTGTTGRLFSRTSILIVTSVATLNVLVAFVTLRNAAEMRDSVLDVGRRVEETASEMRALSNDAGRKILELRTPLVPPNAEDHPTFDRARTDIEEGDYAGARQRLYSLLSVVDRLEESQRRDVEARAQFLLAEATHLEAVSRLEEDE